MFIDLMLSDFLKIICFGGGPQASHPGCRRKIMEDHLNGNEKGMP
jgi:hypothetical protein